MKKAKGKLLQSRSPTPIVKEMLRSGQVDIQLEYGKFLVGQ